MSTHYKGNIKILVTANSEEVGIRLSKILREFEQIKADGRVKNVEALAEYNRHSAEVIILDEYQSDLGTQELMIAVREVSRASISIILTNDPDMRRTCLRSGAQCFLGKSNQFQKVSEFVGELKAVTHN